MTQLVLFFMSPLTSLALFVITIVAQIMTSSAMRQGKLGKARNLATVAFMAASLIVVHQAVLYVVTRSMFALIFGGLWCYFAWSNYKTLKSLPER